MSSIYFPSAHPFLYLKRSIAKLYCTLHIDILGPRENRSIIPQLYFQIIMIGGECCKRNMAIMCGWYETMPHELSERLAPSLVFHIEKQHRLVNSQHTYLKVYFKMSVFLGNNLALKCQSQYICCKPGLPLLFQEKIP